MRVDSVADCRPRVGCSARPAYQLEPLTPEEAARWDDLIAPYPTRELFHHSAWLDYLAASRSIQIRLWKICAAGSTVGYFCGGILLKGPFRILGSPLKGWGTNYMGPVANPDLNEMAFLEALDQLAIRERLAMVELESSTLSNQTMEGCGYAADVEHCYIIELNPNDPEKMWRRLHAKARKAIRLANQFGLTVEETDDASIAEEVYDQYKEVLARKNLYPTFDRACPRLVFNALKPHGLLFAFRVREAGGQVIATGLFPHDDRTMYFSFTGSRISGWGFFPNDLLQWTAMRSAAERGITTYNMCGRGQFKSKFGGTLRQVNRWHKCYSRTARWARRGYEFYFQERNHLRGWWERSASQGPVA
jgi:hypothetical protein